MHQQYFAPCKQRPRVREGWVGCAIVNITHTHNGWLSMCITPWAQWHARMQSGERAGESVHNEYICLNYRVTRARLKYNV